MSEPFLYHATRESNVESIQSHGLLTKYYGAIHDRMDIHPSKSAIYLSRHSVPQNLNTNLFGQGPVVVLKIDTRFLDEEEFYPDDFIYKLVGDGDLFETSGEIQEALKCSPVRAEKILDQIENADDEDLPEVLKPFWKWYLEWRDGGEVAYTADIPPQAIIDVKKWATREDAS